MKRITREVYILILSIVMVLTGCATVPEVIVPQQTVVIVEETTTPRNAEDYPSTQSIPGVTATHGVVVTERLLGLEIPSYIENHPVVAKLGYALSYNRGYVQPDWVAYVLTKDEVESESVGRSDRFYEETAVIPGSALLSDYKRADTTADIS